MKKQHTLFLAPALVIGFMGCSGGSSDNNVAVTGVTLTSTLSVQIGKTATLTASVQPSNATNKGITWQSSNTGIATVNNGTVTGVAIGETTITATTTDGNKTATCALKVTQYDPVEEVRRLAEFNRLSAPVKKDETIIEVKTIEDFLKGVSFGYGLDTHVIFGHNFILSSTVTGQLKEELEKEVERRNFNLAYSWEHEFRHGANAKYVWAIKEPKNNWKAYFSDEISAYLASTMLFRKNMLEEYAKQLELAGRDPQKVNFSALSYQLATGMGIDPNAPKTHMITWWDMKNNFMEMKSSVSQDEATQLMDYHFNYFLYVFNSSPSYADIMNNMCFSTTTFTPCSYDTDEWLMTGLNAMFTYKIGDKDVNLFALMTPAGQQAFLKKLNDKMEEEYAAWLAGK
ncbi:MAG: Ig-like domain-containing protein [Holophagaceae bacterium]|nr:Ig-like domain-containing protein [Holophagaceae bacterium]